MQNANTKAYSGSKWGRLVRPINKLTNTFRWMGCRFAVYEAISPVESGLKVRKDPGGGKRQNRRGHRSTRGGRKRRALVGAAPQTLRPRVSGSDLSDRVLLRRMRTFDYSTRLAAHVRGLKDAINRIGDKARMAPLGDNVIKQHAAAKVALSHASKRWFALRRGTHPGEPPFSRNIAYQMETGETPRDLNLQPAKGEVLAQVIPSPRSSNTSGMSDERPMYWCDKCCIRTPSKVCRSCGGALADLDRKKRMRDRKDHDYKNCVPGQPGHFSCHAPRIRAGPKGKGILSQKDSSKVPKVRCSQCLHFLPCSCSSSPRRK